jgi:hypothetical protein
MNAGPVRSRRALLLGAAGLLAGCGALLLSRPLRIEQADLAERLDRRFPIERQVLERWTLRLADPKLELLAQDDRIGLSFALQMADRRSERRIDGSVALDFGLRFEPADASLRLRQPHLRRIVLGEGVPNALLAGAAGLAERFLDDLPVYTVPAQQLRTLQALGLQPGPLRVLPDAVLVSFEPRR